MAQISYLDSASVLMYVCVCVRERERQKEREIEREREMDRCIHRCIVRKRQGNKEKERWIEVTNRENRPSNQPTDEHAVHR